MAKKITWTEQALADLDIICEFIARDSIKYAIFFAANALEKIERLQDFPYSGRILPELKQKEIREIIFSSYRIIYKIGARNIEILTIYHGARLFNSRNLTH